MKFFLIKICGLEINIRSPNLHKLSEIQGILNFNAHSIHLQCTLHALFEIGTLVLPFKKLNSIEIQKAL